MSKSGYLHNNLVQIPYSKDVYACFVYSMRTNLCNPIVLLIYRFQLRCDHLHPVISVAGRHIPGAGFPLRVDVKPMLEKTDYSYSLTSNRRCVIIGKGKEWDYETLSF